MQSDRLDDYERGLGEGAELDAYEQDLFARALSGRAPELTLRDALAATLGEMGRRGTIEIFPSAEAVAVLRARTDLKVEYVDLEQTGFSSPLPSAGADVVITRVTIPRAAVERLEVEVGFVGGPVLKTMPDVSFDRQAGEVFFCCDGDLARAVAGTPFARFWAIEGERRTLLSEVVVTVR